MIGTSRLFSLSSSLSRLLVVTALLVVSSVTTADNAPSCTGRKATGDDDINRSASFERLTAIVVGNGVTVAVGNNTILVTTDHKTWVRHRTTKHYDPKGYFVDVVWDGNRFVALTLFGKIYISDANATKWTEQSEIRIAEPPPNKVEFRKIRFNKGLYVVLSDSKATNVYLSYGDDALQWKTDRVEGYSHYGPVIQITWARDRYYIAPSMMPGLKPHLISYQGTQITVELPKATPFTTAYDDNKYIRAFGSHISHSEDGKSWKKVWLLDNKNYPVRTLRYLNGKYLIGTGCGGFMSSDNGIDWETHQTQGAAFVEEIIWTGKEYLAVGGKYSRGAIFISPDGKNWKALFERNGDIVVRNASMPALLVTLSPSTLKKDGKLVSITATITVNDNYDPLPEIKLESITANEPLEKEDIKDAKIGTDDREFKLKAEREGKNKAGRIYTVTYSATDASGNKATASATVTVPHDERKKDD